MPCHALPCLALPPKAFNRSRRQLTILADLGAHGEAPSALVVYLKRQSVELAGGASRFSGPGHGLEGTIDTRPGVRGFIPLGLCGRCAPLAIV